MSKDTFTDDEVFCLFYLMFSKFTSTKDKDLFRTFEKKSSIDIIVRLKQKYAIESIPLAIFSKTRILKEK